MKKSLNLFVQLAKIDESRQEVWGTATAEVVDKDGEIFDYMTSKPYFEAWSAEIAKATSGKSLGNVREMHKNSAVGKLVSIEFDDALKQINIGAKIVDMSAWQKCAQGVYTGFSIGGAYIKTWKDGEFVRFTGKPAEISVVDNPCVPSAHFTAVKSDGTAEIRKFHTPIARRSTAAVKKIGARHSQETMAHLQAVQKYMDAVQENYSQAANHMNALLYGDNEAQPSMTEGTSQKNSGGQRPEIQTARLEAAALRERGEHITMLDTQDKGQLEKAQADSATALSKAAEVEQSLSDFRQEMERNNEQLQKSLTGLLSLVEKLVASQPDAARIARTSVPAITVRKEDDSAAAGEKPEKKVHELMKLALQKPQRASSYLR